MYDVDAHVAEIYDQLETKTADVDLIRRLVGPGNRLRILEPFCGTGRVLIPLRSTVTPWSVWIAPRACWPG